MGRAKEQARALSWTRWGLDVETRSRFSKGISGIWLEGKILGGLAQSPALRPARRRLWMAVYRHGTFLRARLFRERTAHREQVHGYRSRASPILAKTDTAIRTESTSILTSSASS